MLRSVNESIVTRQQEINALNWFKKSFLSNDITFNLHFLENNKAFAEFTNTAITLYRGSNYTHLYHEAWHRFTQHYLTEKERTVLYNAISEVTGISKDELLQSEETLAEGFRSLMLSNGETITLKANGKTFTIDMNNPTENQKPVVAWYKKVLDFFKSMFKKSEVFTDYYGSNPINRESNAVEYNEIIKKYMKEASKFKTSRTNLYSVDPNNAGFDQLYSLKTITYEKDGEAITLDSVAMFELQQGIDALFVEAFETEYPNTSIASIDYQPKDGKEQITNFLYEEVYIKIEEHSKTLSETKQKEFDIILYNFNNVIKQTTGFRKNINKYFDEEIELDLETYVLKTSETNEKKSQIELTENTIFKMLETIPRMKNGKQEYSKTWGLPLLADFGSVWGLLQSNLAGKNYNEMLAEIKKLADSKHPELKKLLNQLPKEIVKDSDLYLKIAFEKTFDYNLGNPIITYLDTAEDGKLKVKIAEAGSSNAKQILKKWSNATSNFNYQQIKNVLDGYENFTTLENITVERAVEFLKDLNFEFTDFDLEYAKSKGFKEESFPKAIWYIYNAIKETSKYKADFNPIAQILRDRTYDNTEGKKINVKGEDTSLKVIASLELMTNNYMTDDMVLRSDNTVEWKMKQYNYISRLIYNMEHMSKEELLEVYPQFDRTKNPGIVFSTMYKSLFDKNGNINKGAKLEMFSMTGITDMSNLRGLVTVDLKSPEQALGDFWSYMESGKEQFTRFGDKSSAFGATVSTWKVPKDETDVVVTNRLVSLLQAEIYNYQHFKRVLAEGNIPKSSKQNSHRNKKLIFFDKIISNTDLKDRLINAELTLNALNEIALPSNLQQEVIAEINNYFNSKTESFKSLLTQNLPEGFTESNLLPDNITSSLTEVVNKYLKSSTAHRIDSFLFLFGDLKNFKTGNDVYKRLSSNSATGLFPTLDEVTLSKLGERKIETLYGKERPVTSKFTMAQFNNVPVNLPSILLNAEQDLKAREALEDYIKLDGKDKGDRADAQGAVTLDFYRNINILIGRWDIAQEDAYNAQVEFMKIKNSFNKNDSAYIDALANANKTASDLLVLWNPKKWQYSGSILSKHTVAKDLDLRMFLKFSIAPLIPSVIENTELERVAENMYKSGTDLYTFSSGSKNTTDQENQNFNNWINDDKTEFEPTVLSLHNFKEQLAIDNKFKEEAIFASQMRALLASGLYENGKPLRDVTDYENYKKNLNNLSQLAALELKDKLSTPEKLVSFLEKEFDKREIPHHIKDFITMYKDKPGFTFDTSFQSYYILNTLFSIVTRNLIKPTYNGGQFVQVSDLGYTNATYKDNAVFGNKDLKIYPKNEDGSSGKAEVKIAFSPKYQGLLNLTGIDGERIGDLKRLNQALLNEEWVKKHEDKITLVACRIPVQSFSTMESFIVKEFLERVAGQIVIVPPGLTIKTGSDFDIDKLNIYEPVIDRNGNLVSNDSKDIIGKYKESAELQSKIESKLEALKEENSKLQSKVKEEILPELDALEEETEVVEFPVTGTFNLEDLKDKYKAKEPERKTDLNKSIEELRTIFNKNLATISDLKKELKEVKAYRQSLPATQVNQMISNISKIILAKENRANLLQPNEIKEVDELFIQTGVGKKEDLTLELSDAIDVEVSNQVGQVNFESKNSLGIAAKMNKAFAIFQEVGIRLLSPVKSVFLNKNEGWLSESFTEEYKGIIPIKNVRNGSIVKFTKFIGKLNKVQILSQFVSGTVDVANDPRIGEINFNKKTASVYIHGILKGIHLYDLASIMLNPSVKQLINDLNKRDYLFYKYLVSTVKDDFKKMELTGKKRVKEMALKSVTPTELWKFDEEKFFDLNKTLDAISEYELSKDLPDMLAVAEYLKLEEESKHTTSLSMAMSWDTNNSKSFAEYEQGNRIIRDLKLNKIFDSEGLDKIAVDSSVSSLKMNDFVNQEFGKLFSVINNPVFIENALALYDKTFGVDLTTFMRDYTNDYLTYVYQNYSDVYQTYILDKESLSKSSENNLEQRLKDLKVKLKNTGFEDNYFIQQLIFKKEENSEFMNPQTLSSNVSPIQQTMYHEELMKLYHSDYSPDADTNLEVMEWTKDLIHSALVLNGPVRRTGSIIDYLPQDKLMSYTETVSNHNITKEDLDLFEEYFKEKKASKFFNEFKKNDSVHYNNYFISKQDNEEQEKIPGVENIPNTNLSIEQGNLFIDIIQPQIENQAYVENKAKTANMMFSFGLRWAKNIPNNTEQSEQGKQLGKPRPDRKKINSKEGMTYGYYLTDQNNKPLPSITELKPIIEFIESKLGIDMSNYDAVLGNIYDDNSFIHQHRDTTESVTAEGYPVIVINLGADGHLEYDKNLKSTYATYNKSGQLNLTNGGIYAFGVDGVNRFTFHHRIDSGLESNNPLKPIKLPNGKTLENYRITLTFRRASDLEPGMPKIPNKLKQTPENQEVVETVLPLEENNKIDISNSTKKSPYFEKDKLKFANANKLISRGSANSSSEAYRLAVGNKANVGVYNSTDTVAISAEGNRSGRIKPDYKELEKAVEANVTFITDSTKDRDRSYNIGEREVADYLTSKGYSEEGDGVWTKELQNKTTQPETNPNLEKLKEQASKLKLHKYSPVQVVLLKGSAPMTTYVALKEDGSPIVNNIKGSIFVTMKDGSMFRLEDIIFPENPGTNEICN